MKLLIIRSGALGDTLLLMPLINALSEHQIIILGRKPGIDYLEPYVDQCIDIERGGWHRLFSPESGIDIPCPRVDHVFAFVNDSEQILSGNLTHQFPDSKIDIFPPFPDPDSKDHVAFHMACAFQSAGIPVNPGAIIEAAFNKPVMRSNRGAGKKIILHPGSGSKKKNYPPDFWFNLLEQIKKNHGLYMDICFLLGPAEEDIFSIIEKKAGRYNAEVICPVGEELLSTLNNSYLYIGHDSGVTHLAAMLGINTIALFKNSSIDQWRPLGPSVKIIDPNESPDMILQNTATEIQAILCNQHQRL